jgi:hypothetical protein
LIPPLLEHQASAIAYSESAGIQHRHFWLAGQNQWCALAQGPSINPESMNEITVIGQSIG